MNKKVELNSYARTDENRGDYMVYEIKYSNGYKEYVSRDVFRRLKALEIIKTDMPNLTLLASCSSYQRYKEKSGDNLTKEEYEFLKKVLV